MPFLMRCSGSPNTIGPAAIVTTLAAALVIAMTAALGRWEEFSLHVRAALKSGDLSQDDLKEVLLQSAVYCGVPTANTAFREARAVITDLAK